MSHDLFQLVYQVSDIFKEIDIETSRFGLASGIRCRSGCGDCCRSPTIEATVLEMLPAAAELLESGKADEIFTEASERATCLFYEPRADDPSFGTCKAYAVRPAVCRLFGFAAVRRKNKAAQFAACQWQKELSTETVTQSQQRIDAGELTVPMFEDYGMRIRMLTARQELSQPLPINTALTQAVEKLAFAQSYMPLDVEQQIDQAHAAMGE